jgi:tellurite resistance protein TehA-like permease
MVSGRRLRLIFLVLIAFVLAGLFAWPWIGILGHSSPCGTWPTQEPPNPVLGRQFGTVALCTAALLVGAMTTYLGRRTQFHGLLEGGTTDLQGFRFWVQVGLAALFVFGAAALFFESWAVLNHDWAVTQYVQCANDVSPWGVAAAACALCLLLGNWLWHAAPSRRSS